MSARATDPEVVRVIAVSKLDLRLKLGIVVLNLALKSVLATPRVEAVGCTEIASSHCALDIGIEVARGCGCSSIVTVDTLYYSAQLCA
ncbi:MAG: hypothetical protein QW828_07845, partial [Candidatus Bathyarchaeia archaeon]